MAISFSASPSSLVLTPPSVTGGNRNATAAGNAVNLSNIWKANRVGSFDPGAFTAVDTASTAVERGGAMKSEAQAYATSLAGNQMVVQAKKDAEAIKAAAKKKARKGIFGSALGAVAGIGGTILSGGNPLVGMAAAKGGQALGSAFG